MFAQMIQFVRFMHETMHCCNLDISLENMLIRGMFFWKSMYIETNTNIHIHV